ncbi:MAG: Ig-like domain-containing protein, partial [Thermoleophilia bacterium]|nr:Ig-like domain-containing protein [Thermoleophilia bacterium]
MRGFLGGMLVVAALAVAVPPAQGAESGINIAIQQTVDGPSNAQRLKVGWVRMFVGWSLGEPAPGQYDAGYLDQLKREADRYRARGVKTLFVVQDTPSWAAGPNGAGPAPPADASTYGRFVAELARVANPAAIEIWNEADSDVFWRGAPDPAGYTSLLQASYQRIKAAAPNVTVVTSGMVGNHYEFLEQMYAAGAAGNFDAVGVHTDTACLLTSPKVYYREPNGRVGRFSFTGYREVHNVMAANGDAAKGVWMTEIGWNTGSRKPNSCRDGAVAGTRAEGVSERTQARFLKLAYRCLAGDPEVRVALWFSLQDVGGGAGFGDHLGLIRKGGKRKPAYKAMREVRNGKIGRTGCGGRSDRSAPSLAVSRPTEGAVFTDGENLPMRVTARDSGTGMRRVELYVDGKRVRTWGGGRVRSSWFGFSSLGYGDHAVEIRALDQAQNETVRRLTVRKVSPSSFGDSAAPSVRWRSFPKRAGASLRLAVVVRDRGAAGLRKITLYVDGVRVRTTKRGDGLWRPRIHLRGSGKHRI